jgi:hypothetical protein
MAGRQRRELFLAPDVGGTVADEDCTNALLRKSCERRFEIAVGSGIHNNELQAQRARRRLQVWDDGGVDRDNGRVRPSVFAVLMLMTSSTFVTCCTGRVFSPLRIRPM